MYAMIIWDTLKEPRTPLAAIEEVEKDFSTGPHDPKFVGYQIVEQSAPTDKQQSMRVVAWDSEGFARREYWLQRAPAGGWGIPQNSGCPTIPANPRPTGNDLA